MTSFYKIDVSFYDYVMIDKMDTKRKKMATPEKNAITSYSMCTSGYTQQEISNILSVSDQSGISKFLKRYNAR